MPSTHGDHRPLRRRLLALLFALSLAGAPPAFAASLDEARSLAAAGKLAQALGAVDEVLADRPEDVAALLLRGVLLSRAGRSDEAIEVFNTIATTRPELPEPHNNLAVLYAAQGRYEEARGALVDAIRLQPDYALAHENLGDVYAKLAALSYARANQIDPANRAAANKSAAAEDLIGGATNAVTGQTPAASRTPARVTTRTEPPKQAPVPPHATRASTRAPAAGTAAEACVSVAGITPASRAQGVAQWMQQHGMDTKLAAGEQTSQTRSVYRVLIPSQGSAASARKRIAELRGSGITDLIMITDATERYGISLGVFAHRESAERRARQLKDRNIDTQIAELDRTRPATTSITARGPFAPAEFARAFPDLLPQVSDCP